MKDINDLKNYRLKYKRYYDIDFDKSYDIHHIDFNRKNNDINNLLLLPKTLHSTYHLLINKMGGMDETGKVKFSVRINLSVSNYDAQIIELLAQTIQEIEKWVVYKHELTMKIQTKEQMLKWQR